MTARLNLARSKSELVVTGSEHNSHTVMRTFLRARGSNVIGSTLSRWPPTLVTRNGPLNIDAKPAGPGGTGTTRVDTSSRLCDRATKVRRYALAHPPPSWGASRLEFSRLAYVKQSALRHPDVRVESGLPKSRIHLHPGPSCLIPDSRTPRSHVPNMRYGKQVFGRPCADLCSLHNATVNSMVAAGELFDVPEVHEAFGAVHIGPAKRVARFPRRRFGIQERHAPPPSLRPAGLRGYHSSARKTTQAATSSQDTSKAEPSKSHGQVLLSEWLAPYRDEIAEKKRAGWTHAEVSDWLELRGISLNTDSLKYIFKAWAFTQPTPLEKLEPFKEALIERREATASFKGLAKWLQTQGVVVNDVTVQKVFKQWGMLAVDPKRIQLEETLEFYKEDIIQLRRAGASVMKIRKWLDEQGAKVGTSTIGRRLASWNVPVPEQNRMAPSEDLEPFKDTITRTYRDGASLEGIREWLETLGVKVHAITLKRWIFEWGHLNKRNRFAKRRKKAPKIKRHIELEPYKDTLISKYDSGLGQGTVHLKKYLKSQGIAMDCGAIAWRLREWGVYEKHVTSWKDIDAFKDEIIRRYQAGAPTTGISLWLREQGANVGRTLVIRRLGEWGVYLGKRTVSFDLEQYREELIRLHREGSTVPQMQKWLEGRDVYISPTVLVRSLRKAGVADLPFEREGIADFAALRKGDAQASGKKDDGGST